MSDLKELLVASIQALNKPLFLGQHLVSLDDKDRLCIPKNFRNVAQSRNDGDLEFWLTSGMRAEVAYLACYDSEGFKLQYLVESMRELRGEPRLFDASSTYRLDADNQGRIKIPGELISYAGIERNATVVAAPNMSYFEIWSPQNKDKGYRIEPILDHNDHQSQILASGEEISLII